MSGRPSKLTPAVQKRIAKLVSEGNYPETAARLAGISPSTFYAWILRGRKDKRGPYSEFLESIKKASAVAEAKAVAEIRRAGRKNWTASATFLERRFPTRWGRRERLELVAMKERLKELEKVASDVESTNRTA
jgi:hypothetical protein